MKWPKGILSGFAALITTFVLATMSPAGAGEKSNLCESLWEKRNAIFASAGHCFKTKKGKDNFSNQGCNKGGAKLTARDKAQINQIKGQERAAGCGGGGSKPRPQVQAGCERMKVCGEEDKNGDRLCGWRTVCGE